MRTLAEVLALQDTDQKICYLKKARKTDLSDAVKLHTDWNPNKHEIITDEEKYPKIKVTVGTEPVLDCKPEQSEEGLLSALKQVFKKHKIKYQNKKAVRAWLAGHRPEAYCEKIKTLRIRLEKLLSNYADCIDYHFFPPQRGEPE